MSYKVTLHPVGIEMEVQEGETILSAAFRQGVTLNHGCKEGQCSSCKSLLVAGDIELKRYSTFALPDYEKDTGHILLCRTHAHSDLEIELLNFDEDVLRLCVPARDFHAVIVSNESLTHDIRLLKVALNESHMRFHAGQYADISLPGCSWVRSYSMANPPDESDELEFIIKILPAGRFSGLLENTLRPGGELNVRGPFGTCILRDTATKEVLLLGGGAGLAPLWSIINDVIRRSTPRKVKFFYGARSKRDLFYLDKVSDLCSRKSDFHFVPALSEAHAADEWDGEVGLITDVMDRHLGPVTQADIEPILCGPSGMVDAAIAVLRNKGIDPGYIRYDKFVPAAT